MAGLDLLARKSLERSSEASILISGSFLSSNESKHQDHWSWRHLREQFCIKNAESLFEKYQSRLQHAMLFLILTANVLSGAAAILLLCLYSENSINNLKTPLGFRIALTSASLVLYIISYQERWFFSACSRLIVSFLILTLTVAAEMASSIRNLTVGLSASPRFSAYPLLSATIFLPFPKWYQVGLAAAFVTVTELVIAGFSYQLQGEINARQMSTDVICHVTVALMGLYIRFLMEFTNRKAFLDRRECFESKFHLEYEKDQEERLLLSVLPKHISVQVREGIREVIRRINLDPVPQRPFTELFVEKHRNVSILYADIVNSVALTASLHVSELVETLNELFGRFDDSAERNSCLRIKLLGDCYYCVSGVPDSDPQHADHCVQMALDMIDIIRNFREETHVNVDMRIGVHSGNVLSGLLGLRKWQFDIWSRDVTIASRMEQSGRPGCVHVSRATKDLLQGKYNIEPGNGNIRDEYLNKLDMETFFITPYKKNQLKRDSLYVPIHSDRSPAHSTRRISSLNQSKAQRKLSSATEILSSRRRTVLGFSLLQFRQMVSQVNEFMETAIDAMALSKKDQWFKPEGIQPLLLTFHDRSVEVPFLKQKDPLFKYSLLSTLFMCFVIITVSALVKPSMNYLWIAGCTVFLICITSVICSWLAVIAGKLKKSSKLQFIIIFQKGFSSVLIRTILFTLLTLLLMTVAMMGLEGCRMDSYIPSFPKNTTFSEEKDIACEHPWYFTWCAILSMISISVFLRIHFLMKLLVNGTLVAAFSYIIHSKTELFNKPYIQDWDQVPRGVDQYWCLLVTLFTLHLLDRQVEYIGRLDYLWKRKLRKEQEEATTMGLVNRTLLQNILPVHVAQYYLTKESMHLDLDLYHEEYSSVAVMFASIPNYMDFYSESLLNDEGRKCLQVLHEIICDFDKLLYEPPFLKLEKIKTIGSTYMAAAGLQPGRNSSRTSYESFGPEEDGTQNVLVMTKFAMTIMDVLQEMNRHSWQQFHLRIGIAMGPVLAGVVGASKPQYDIWGDTVNIASRMDSTGVTGAIQVTERVASILQESGKYDVQCRGQIFIKGKGWMTTYLVHQTESTRL
ncbi:adenylate cyclase type 2-like isoform X3 [Stegodyphus dumicola]|nr:adenylate cyclase type 2-like isoform X3 [Stegodyphus dumicola]XP_035212479.1 adenylate cyclase type 2-like isoform X3 [Stegodyphus dumicola]